VTPTSSPFRITASIELYGDGPGTAPLGDGTVLAPRSQGQDVLSIEPAGVIDSVCLRDFKIRENPLTPPYYRPQRGIVCVPAANTSVQSLRMERVWVLRALDNGIHVEGNGTTSFVDRLAILNAASGFAGGWGVYVRNARHFRMLRTECGGNVTGGMYCESAGACFYSSGFEGNGQGSSGTVPVISAHLKSCEIADLDWCRFERFIHGSVNTALRLEQCRGATQLTNCGFFYPRPDEDPNQRDSTGVELPAGSGPANILGCSFARVHPNLIQIDSTDLGVSVWPQFNGVEPSNIKPGRIAQPGANNRGLLSLPYVRRQLAPNVTDSPAGLIAPSIAALADPTTAVQNGMIYYNANPDTTALRARIAGQWKTVNVQT
jgi:hypothetical protein